MEFEDKCKNRQTLHIDGKGKGKGKFHPRTGHEGPGGSRGIALLFL